MIAAPPAVVALTAQRAWLLQLGDPAIEAVLNVKTFTLGVMALGAMPNGCEISPEPLPAAMTEPAAKYSDIAKSALNFMWNGSELFSNSRIRMIHANVQGRTSAKNLLRQRKRPITCSTFPHSNADKRRHLNLLNG